MAWDESKFDLAYSSAVHLPEGFVGEERLAPQLRLGYHRGPIYPTCQKWAAKARESLALDGGSRVLILGAGFGWEAEALIDLGVDAVAWEPPTSWIHTAKNTPEHAGIASRLEAIGMRWDQGLGKKLHDQVCGAPGGDCSSTPARVTIESAPLKTLGEFTHTILRNVLSVMSDAEISDLLALDNTGQIVVYDLYDDPRHPVTVPDELGILIKTKASWSQRYPTIDFRGR